MKNAPVILLYLIKATRKPIDFQFEKNKEHVLIIKAEYLKLLL